jgi:hypothetical protein
MIIRGDDIGLYYNKNRPKKYLLAGKNWWRENVRFCPKEAEKMSLHFVVL